jgi:hypothetical protein
MIKTKIDQGKKDKEKDDKDRDRTHQEKETAKEVEVPNLQKREDDFYVIFK